MQIMSVTRQQLAARFWDEIFPSMREKAELEHAEVLTLQVQGPYKDNLRNVVPEHMASFKRLTDEVYSRVKQELFDLSFMHFSCPTKFSLILLDSTIKHFTDVKREMLGPKAQRHLLVEGYGDYDVEADIALTNKHVEKFKSEHLNLERQYFAAMNEKRYIDAASLVRAILIIRQKASIGLQAEANNWRFEVACATGDADMFMDAWKNTHPSAMIDPRMFYALLEKLLYSGFIKGIKIGLSAEGQRAMSRLGAGSSEEFHNEQAAMYLRSVVESLAASLINNACTDGNSFRALIKTELERSQKSWLGVNPYLAVLEVAWK